MNCRRQNNLKSEQIINATNLKTQLSINYVKYHQNQTEDTEDFRCKILKLKTYLYKHKTLKISMHSDIQ